MQQGDTASSMGTSTNLTQLVHSVIRNIDTYGGGNSCPASQRQLKPNLPQFCHLNRTLSRTLTPGTTYCCLTAECLYVRHSDTTPSRKTDAERKRDSRQNRDSRQTEQSLDTLRRKTRRKDDDVKEREQSLNTARRKTQRQDDDVRQREQSLDTARRKTKRQDDNVRQREQSLNTPQRKTQRKLNDVRQREQSLDTARRKTKRQDDNVRQREQSLDTARRKRCRQDDDVRQREQSLNTTRRKRQRQNSDVRQQEQAANTARKQHLRDSTSLSSLIHRFHSIVARGPVYICTSCDQLLYKHSVQLAANIRSMSLSITDSVLLNKRSSDGIEYICNTCNSYLRKNKLPPCAIANNLQFPPIPTHLPVLNMAEWRMLSPRLAFMQIREAVVGKQLRIHGNLICVPADVCTTVNTLPRTSSNFETVAVQLKRRSQYQHAFLTSNIRPACVREVGTYLVENGELFQLQNITFNHSD